MTARWIIPLALGLALSSCSAARIDGSPRRFTGVWLYEFEGSTFIEGAARPPTSRPAYRATDWLEYPPDLLRLGAQVEALGYDADQACHPVQPFLITFIGHRTRRLGGSGHMGLWRSELTPHRTLSIKRLSAPVCFGG